MSTTISIDEGLQARVVAAAERVGKTADAFMLEAIAQTVERVERDEAFHGVADERWDRLVLTGKSVPLAEAKSWLEARVRDFACERPPNPQPEH